MNIATNCKDIKVLKCKHCKDTYRYLVQLTPELWGLLVYDDTDENQIWECVYFSEKDATYAFNHWEKEIN